MNIQKIRQFTFHRLSLQAAALCIAAAGIAPVAYADTNIQNDKNKKLTPAQAAAIAQPAASLTTGRTEGRTDGKSDAPPPGGPESGKNPGTGRDPISTSGRRDNSATDPTAMPSLRADAPTVGASDKTAKPGFNQGFAGQREVTQQQADRAAVGRITNPLKGGLTDGGVVGGPLHDAAASTQNGRGQIGRDAISDGISSPNGTFQNGELQQKGKGGIAKATGLNEKSVMQLVTGGSRFEELERISSGVEGGGGGAAPAAAPEAAKEPVVMCRNADCSRSVSANADGSVTVHETDGSNEVIQPDGSYVKTDKNGQVVDTGAAASTGKPSEDSYRRPTNAEIEKRLADHNYRIKQYAKANGNITPGRESSVAIDRSATVPSTSQTGQALFGQPSQGVVSTSGPRAGLDFNNKNLGAIDPGRDATFTATTGPEQNRAEDALGRQYSTPPVNAPGSSTSDDDDDEDQTAAAK